MAELERFTVSMDRRLLEQFDARNKEHGYDNRSEAIRDLIRKEMVAEEWNAPDGKARVAATVTIVYDHHKFDLARQMVELQHEHGDTVVTTTHVHLDHDNCLEVIILRGESARVQELARRLIAMKGVKHGQGVFTTEGSNIV